MFQSLFFLAATRGMGLWLARTAAMLCQATSLPCWDHWGTQVKHQEVSTGEPSQTNSYSEELVWTRTGRETARGREQCVHGHSWVQDRPLPCCSISRCHYSFLWEQLGFPEILTLPVGWIAQLSLLWLPCHFPAILCTSQDGAFHTRFHTGGSRNEYHLPGVVKRKTIKTLPKSSTFNNPQLLHTVMHNLL